MVEQFASDFTVLNESTKVSLFLEDVLEEYDGRKKKKNYNSWFTSTFIHYVSLLI